jgi:UDP-N-acetylmuramoyl-tripeptide--D-alanyl-D-alanine ligase
MKRKILEFFLLPLAKLVLRRYRPMVIAITGSVGKTSAKEAIAAVLSQKFLVWKTKNNLNTDIGLCLTIIDGENAKGSLIGWLKNIFRGWRLVTGRKYNYPQCLVLEMGADRPGDVGDFMRLVQPHGSVVTAIGSIPVHVANYADIDEVVKEKQKILDSLGGSGWAVLNADDSLVSNMKVPLAVKVFSFGFSEKSEVRIIDYAVRGKDDDSALGISFRLQYSGSSVPVRFSGILGRPYAYACAAAAAVGLACGMNLIDISQGLEKFVPEKGRMRLINGLNQTMILDDSYNAAPAAMKAALETLNDLKDENHRVIGVLGDMLELGKYTEQAHRDIGKQAASVCDILCGVGDSIKFALEQAEQSGLPKSQIFRGQNSEGVAELLQPLLRKNDFILIKGSQGVRMEKITRGLMEKPEQARELLVRQTKEWEK